MCDAASGQQMQNQPIKCIDDCTYFMAIVLLSLPLPFKCTFLETELHMQTLLQSCVSTERIVWQSLKLFFFQSLKFNSVVSNFDNQ